MKQGFEAKAKELGLTPQGLRRQGGRRQRRPGRRDRAADRRRRQGHPAGAERLDRDRADGREGPQGRHPRHHARHAARSDHRRRRQFRHRQLQGRRVDRPVGEGDARRQGGLAPRSPRSISTPNQPTVDYLRHNGFLTGFGIPVKDPKHFAMSDSPQIVGSDVTHGFDGRRPQGDGEDPAEGRSRSTSSMRSTSRRPTAATPRSRRRARRRAWSSSRSTAAATASRASRKA